MSNILFHFTNLQLLDFGPSLNTGNESTLTQDFWFDSRRQRVESVYRTWTSITSYHLLLLSISWLRTLGDKDRRALASTLVMSLGPQSLIWSIGKQLYRRPCHVPRQHEGRPIVLFSSFILSFSRRISVTTTTTITLPKLFPITTPNPPLQRHHRCWDGRILIMAKGCVIKKSTGGDSENAIYSDKNN